MLRTLNPFSVKEYIDDAGIDNLLQLVEAKEKCSHDCENCFLFRDDSSFPLGPECQRDKLKRSLLARKKFLETFKSNGN